MLSELLGVPVFTNASGLSRINLVQQGGEFAYLLLHDPEFRHVRPEHLIEAASASGSNIAQPKSLRDIWPVPTMSPSTSFPPRPEGG